jgi:hypothetical protein
MDWEQHVQTLLMEGQFKQHYQMTYHSHFVVQVRASMILSFLPLLESLFPSFLAPTSSHS